MLVLGLSYPMHGAARHMDVRDASPPSYLTVLNTRVNITFHTPGRLPMASRQAISLSEREQLDPGLWFTMEFTATRADVQSSPAFVSVYVEADLYTQSNKSANRCENAVFVY